MKIQIKLIAQFLTKAVKVRRLIEQAGSFEDSAATLLQVEALKYIQSNSDSTVGSLAHELAMSLSSTTQLTNRLVDKEWIVRETNQKDRRVIGLRLTKLGKEQMRVCMDRMFSSHFKILASVPESDLREMIRIFENIANSQKGVK